MNNDLLRLRLIVGNNGFETKGGSCYLTCASQVFWVACCLVNHNTVHLSLWWAEWNVLIFEPGLVYEHKCFLLHAWWDSTNIIGVMLRFYPAWWWPAAQWMWFVSFSLGFQRVWSQSCPVMSPTDFSFPAFFPSCFLPLCDCHPRLLPSTNPLAAKLEDQDPKVYSHIFWHARVQTPTFSVEWQLAENRSQCFVVE